MAKRTSRAAEDQSGQFGADEKRQSERHPFYELGMLWSAKGEASTRLGSAMVTNVSIGGVQVRTKHPAKKDDSIVLELGTDDGPVFLPGGVRYSRNGHADGSYTLGVKFQPETKEDRQALAQFVLGFKDKIFETELIN